MAARKKDGSSRSYTISLDHRKARGSGHERLPEILTAARALFAELGVENVTTRAIAARVGISQAALFAYYRNKDEIFIQVMHDAFAELARTLEDVDRQAVGTVDWLRRMIAGYVAFGLAHPDEYRLAFMVIKTQPRSGPAPEPTGRVAAIALPLFQQLERKVAAAIDEGVVRRDLGSSELTTQALWAAIHGLTAILIARPSPHFPWAELPDLIRAHTDLLLNGMLGAMSLEKQG
jgi:AcrR family transcriptional regulator